MPQASAAGGDRRYGWILGVGHRDQGEDTRQGAAGRAQTRSTPQALCHLLKGHGTRDKRHWWTLLSWLPELQYSGDRGLSGVGARVDGLAS